MWLILQDVADVASARTWLGSDEMKIAMQKSGVLGLPGIQFAAALLLPNRDCNGEGA
jgi:hypothetical protein